MYEHHIAHHELAHLDNVVLLATPVNPDGYELVANAYMATRSTHASERNVLPEV